MSVILALGTLIYDIAQIHFAMNTIASLTDGAKRVSITGKLVWVTPEGPRTGVSKSGIAYTVISTLVRDETGSINLSIFGDAAKLAKKGSLVAVTNGYVTSFNDKLQLNVGRFGKLSIE